MIPFVASETTKPVGPMVQTSEVLSEGEVSFSFSDLLADNTPVPDKTVLAPTFAGAEPEAVVSTDLQQSEQDAAFALPSEPDLPKAPPLDAKVLIRTSDPEKPLNEIAVMPRKTPQKADLTPEDGQGPISVGKKGETPLGDHHPARPSVAQTVVEGRIPRSAQMVGRPVQDKTANPTRAAFQDTLPRTRTVPKPEQSMAQVADTRLEPKRPVPVLPEKALAHRPEELPRMTAAATPPAASTQIPAATQPPAVGLVQAHSHLKQEMTDKHLKVLDADMALGAVSSDRHGPAPTVQGTATTAASPETARQVATQIAMAITNNAGKTTEIALNPEELGRVRLSMTAGDGAITLNVLAERPETQDLLRRHIEVLAQEFRDLGYTSISFSFGEQKDDARSETPQQEPVIEPDGQGPSDKAINMPGQPRTGLDLRI